MRKFVGGNLYLICILFLYSFLMVSVIKWGIPNLNHPFNYHMDEWHQMQAVRDLFKYGTNNIEGAAHGPVLQFLIGGIFLAPFALFKYIDPFSITSSVQNLAMQEKIFEVLRLNTLLFGILSIIFLWKIIKNNFQISPIFPVLLFTFTPIWLSLSNYFKYDIALIFWINLSIFAMFVYYKKPSTKKFLFAAICSGLALSAKISAIPIFGVLIFSYFLFTPNFKKHYKRFIYGILAFILTFMIFGIPDLVFLSKGNYYIYFYDNLVSSPKINSIISLGMPWYSYITLIHYPMIYGLIFYLLSLLSIIFLIYQVVISFSKKTLKKNKIAIFILFSLVVFALSLIVLKIDLRGNRSIVFLPFLTLSIAYLLGHVSLRVKRSTLALLLSVLALIQIHQSLPYVSYKTKSDSKEISSTWIKANIKMETVIGLQNIPIYQGIPDFILKDYYTGLSKGKTSYRYQIIDSKSKDLPEIIVLTNIKFKSSLENSTEEKNLLKRLKVENYSLYKTFEPDLTYQSFRFSDFNNLLFSGMIPISSISIYKK